MNRISDTILQMEAKRTSLLGSVRLGPNLVLASDSSGHHSSAVYESYSFLLVDFVFGWLWEEMRQSARRDALRDNRRLSFKTMNDRRQRAALVPYLRAANTLPGTLFTVLVDRRTSDLVARETEADLAGTEFAGLLGWKHQARERLMRVAHFGALLIAGLCARDQNILWIHDEDDITANNERICLATKIISHVMNHYLDCDMGHFRFCSTKSDDGSRAIEDLVAIPDLVAGSLCECLEKQSVPGKGLVVPLDSLLSRKAKTVLKWYADMELHSLKRVAIAIDDPDGRGLRIRGLDLSASARATEFFWHSNVTRRVRLYLPPELQGTPQS